MTKKKTTKEIDQPKIKAMSGELLTHNLFVLKQMVDTLNVAIAAVAKAADIKGDALSNVTGDEYMNWVQDTLHPLIRDADKLHREWAEATSKEAEKAVEEAAEEKEDK